MQNRVKYILFLFLVLMLTPVHLLAQGQADTLTAIKNLSLDTCLKLAVQNNADVINATLAIEEAEQTKKGAFTKYFPQFTAGAGAFHSNRPFIELGIKNICNTGVRDLLYTLYYNYGSALGLSDRLSFLEYGFMGGVMAMQPIYAGGRIVTGNKLANLGIEASGYKRDIIERDLKLSVEELYWQTKMLEEKRRTVEAALRYLSSLEKDVRIATEAGLITPNDGLKVKLKINEMNTNIIKIDNGIKLCKRALCQQIGVQYNDSVCISDTLPAVREPWELRVEAETAVQSRSEFKLLGLNVKAQNLQKRMIIGETLPQIGLGASYSYNNLMYSDATNLTGFAMVQVPLTAWWEASHSIKKQNLKIQEAENTSKDYTEKMELQTQKIWDELDAAYRSHALAVESVNDAAENLKLSDQYYKSGVGTMSDLLEAETIYRQAEDAECEQRIAYNICLRHYLLLTRSEK